MVTTSKALAMLLVLVPVLWSGSLKEFGEVQSNVFLPHPPFSSTVLQS